MDFHSFRHLAGNILIGNGCDEGVVNYIVGHASAMRSETGKTYSGGAFLNVKADVLKRLNLILTLIILRIGASYGICIKYRNTRLYPTVTC